MQSIGVLSKIMPVTMYLMSDNDDALIPKAFKSSNGIVLVAAHESTDLDSFIAHKAATMLNLDYQDNISLAKAVLHNTINDWRILSEMSALDYFNNNPLVFWQHMVSLYRFKRYGSSQNKSSNIHTNTKLYDLYSVSRHQLENSALTKDIQIPNDSFRVIHFAFFMPMLFPMCLNLSLTLVRYLRMRRTVTLQQVQNSSHSVTKLGITQHNIKSIL